MSIKGTEQSLLLGVRSRLRLATGSGGAGFADKQCDIEFQQMAAAVAPDIFVCISPAQFEPTGTHGTSGTIRDVLVGCDVTVYVRTAHIARDRQRNPFALGTTTLQDQVDKIFDVVDWKYEVITAANVILAVAPYSSTAVFEEPLKFAGMSEPQEVDVSGVFAAAPPSGARTAIAAMARTIRFRNARRTVVIP